MRGVLIPLRAFRVFGLTPLSILEDGTIVSGHRRWKAAVELGLTEVPVRILSFEDGLAIERAIIESNRQREKTFSQKMREAEELERIEAVLAEQRRREKISRYRKTGETCPEGDTSSRSAETVAQTVGIGGKSQYYRAKKVWEAAKSGDDKAQELVEKLDNEETTISAACNEIKQQEKMEVHYSSETPEWGTPQKIVKRVISVFGKIDLDPCSDGVRLGGEGRRRSYVGWQSLAVALAADSACGYLPAQFGAGKPPEMDFAVCSHVQNL